MHDGSEEVFEDGGGGTTCRQLHVSVQTLRTEATMQRAAAHQELQTSF